METDLASFLSPAGSLIGDVTQRVLEFLSVQDLLVYVASSCQSPSTSCSSNDSSSSSNSPLKSPAGTSTRGCTTKGSDRAAAAGWKDRSKMRSYGSSTAPEEELPHHYDGRCDEYNCNNNDNRNNSEQGGPVWRAGGGGGDEAGGGCSRETMPSNGTDIERDVKSSLSETHRNGGKGNSGGYSEAETGSIQEKYAQQLDKKNPCFLGLENTEGFGRKKPDGNVLVFGHETHDGEELQRLDINRGNHSKSSGATHGSTRRKNRHSNNRSSSSNSKSRKTSDPNLLGILIGLGLHPWAALGAIRGGVSHILGGVPLLALLRWAAGGASAVLGITFRVALLPYDVTRGVVSYVVGSLEAMLNVATEIWCELRHLSLAELAVVVSCVVSGSALPDFLLNPADGVDGGGAGGGGGSSCSGGKTGRARMLSRSSRGSAHFESGGGYDYASEYSRGYVGSGESAQMDVSDAWRQAHAMRRRLDRVNRTSSLVAYEERPNKAVPRAKAERVRRRMHYPMPLQCFQATVTIGSQGSPATSDLGDDADGGTSAGGGSASAFMCTPQSFPPTPVSRAHVMARTSRFSDDVLFLARDQLRLGENLKPGMDETTRATADFLRRQQRLAVLDGNDACEGIVLTCGHHRATKVGPFLYSSARAMVPVLRNRHVYFQFSCMREGPLAPSVGIGLSTPEMPLSTLVGAFSNSVGLCSTGQVLMSSRWYGQPGQYAMRKTPMSTVGVLVYLDGSRSFRSWDGDMVRALVCFNVDGRLVRIASGHVPPSLAATVVGVAGVGNGEFDPERNAGNAPRSQHQQHQQQPPEDGPPPPPSPLPEASDAPSNLPPSWAAGGASEETAPWEVAAASAAMVPIGPPGGPGYKRDLGVAGRVGRGANSLRVPGAQGRGGGAAGGRGGGMPQVPAPGASAALGLALPKDRDLFPTVTIHSPNTEVLCRFCAEDLLHVSRDSIGAPPGVTVYALDGSLINI